jgi:hypothetical protein
MTAASQRSDSNASDGAVAVVCPKCRRPKATPRDIIRWLSDADGYEKACFDGVTYPRLLPEEEAVPGAERLKTRMVELRRQKDLLLCLALEGIEK